MSDEERWTDLEPDEARFLEEFGPRLAALRPGHARCPNLASILAAQSGVLPADRAAQLAAHMASCDWCRALASDLREFEFPEATPEADRRIRARLFAGETAGRPRPSRVPWRWLVPLGATAGLVLTVLLVRDGVRPGPPPAATIATPAGGAAAQAPGAGASRLATVLRLEKPPVRLPLEAAMIWRGEADRDRARFAEKFKAAMVPYRADDFGAAAAQLERMGQEFTGSPDVSFYLGVCQLFLGRDRDAIASLEQARTLARADLADDVSWYLALAHQRIGQVDHTLDLLGTLCQSSKSRSAQACAAIQELKTQGPGTDRR